MSIPPIDYIVKQYEHSNVQTTPFLLVKSEEVPKSRNIQKKGNQIKSNKKKKIKYNRKKIKKNIENRLIPYSSCVPRNINLKFSSTKKIVKRDNEIKTILNEMSDKMIKKKLIKEKIISDSSRAPTKLLKDVYSYVKSSNISIHRK